jgi:two-component system, NtrC family, response regulator GlrR
MTLPPQTVLLTHVGELCPQLDVLRGILESESISVLKLDTSATSLGNESLSNFCTENSVSLVIHCLDEPAGASTTTADIPCVEVPVIVATKDHDSAQIRSMLEQGVTDFVTPPFTATNILPRVWRLLRFPHEDSKYSDLHERLAIQRLGLIGESSLFLDEIRKLKLLARCDITVMIGGETGTGKELIARAVHYLSARSDRPFIAIDCGAIPAELTESELFGHERGAFTGAMTKNLGLIAAADQGTLFLDEVDALSLHVQAKLLRFLQEMEYRPLGSTEVKKADVRIISATNRDLLEQVQANEFRNDLYYRLNVVQLRLPGLRQRREDIVVLARHFVGRYVIRYKTPARDFSRDAIQKLLAYNWPGNIRELENVVGAAVALCEGPLICANDLTLNGDDQAQSPTSFREAKAQIIVEFERDYILSLLNSCNGNVSQAARTAGKNRRAFWELIRKHGINANSIREESNEEPLRKANARSRRYASG